MAVEILFVMAGYNKESQAIANEVSKMQESQASKKKAQIPAKICFPPKGESMINYRQVKDLWG